MHRCIRKALQTCKNCHFFVTCSTPSQRPPARVVTPSELPAHTSPSLGGTTMLENNLKTVRTDLRSLLRDAQDLFREATSSTGMKADDLRERGLELLDTALVKAQDLQSVALDTSKEVVDTADSYVKDNPWRAVAISAGVGVLLGMMIGRR